MIRQANERDLVAVRACAIEAFSQYVQAIGKKPAPMSSDFETQIANGWIYISEADNGDFAGYITFFPEEDHLHLESIAVLNRFVGKGHGRSLVRFCENEARQRGFKAVELYTNQLMTANLEIYPKLGYRETDRREDQGYKRVFYRKDIA